MNYMSQIDLSLDEQQAIYFIRKRSTAQVTFEPIITYSVVHTTQQTTQHCRHTQLLLLRA